MSRSCGNRVAKMTLKKSVYNKRKMGKNTKLRNALVNKKNLKKKNLFLLPSLLLKFKYRWTYLRTRWRVFQHFDWKYDEKIWRRLFFKEHKLLVNHDLHIRIIKTVKRAFFYVEKEDLHEKWNLAQCRFKAALRLLYITLVCLKGHDKVKKKKKYCLYESFNESSLTRKHTF